MDAEAMLAEVPGLTYRKLDYWTTYGLLRADNNQPGSGRARNWPETEARVARIMVRLAMVGCSPALAEQLARAVGSTVEVADGIHVGVWERATLDE